MAELLGAVTADTNGTAASHTGPCTVYVSGDFGGDDGRVDIFMAHENVAGSFRKIKTVRPFTQSKHFACDGQGTYFLKANFKEGSSGSSGLSVDTTL